MNKKKSFPLVIGLGFVSFIFLVGPLKADEKSSTQKSFSECFNIAGQVIHKYGSNSGSKLGLSDMASISKEGFLDLDQSNIYIAGKDLSGGNLTIVRNQNDFPSGLYLSVNFSRDKMGKVNGIKVFDENTVYEEIHFDVDDAKNTCVVDNVVVRPFGEVNFSLKSCGTASIPSSTCKGPDFLLNYAKRILEIDNAQNNTRPTSHAAPSTRGL